MFHRVPVVEFTGLEYLEFYIVAQQVSLTPFFEWFYLAGFLTTAKPTGLGIFSREVESLLCQSRARMNEDKLFRIGL